MSDGGAGPWFWPGIEHGEPADYPFEPRRTRLRVDGAGIGPDDDHDYGVSDDDFIDGVRGKIDSASTDQVSQSMGTGYVGCFDQEGVVTEGKYLHQRSGHRLISSRLTYGHRRASGRRSSERPHCDPCGLERCSHRTTGPVRTGSVSVHAESLDVEGHPRSIYSWHPTIDSQRTGPLGHCLWLFDHRPCITTGDQRPVGAVSPVAEALDHQPHAGRTGWRGHRTPRGRHQDRTPRGQRLDHDCGHLWVGGHPVIEGTVGLDIGDERSDRGSLLDQGLPLLDHIVSQSVVGRVLCPSTEPLPVAVGDMGADRHPASHTLSGRSAHRGPAPGVKPARHAGTGDESEQSQIRGRQFVALGQVRVEVDGWHCTSIGHGRRPTGMSVPGGLQCPPQSRMTRSRRGAIVPAMPQPPALTPEQRQAALAKAARVRRERAEVKEKLKIGSIDLPELLVMAEGNETIGKMKVLSVLESLPGLGKVKARRMMETVGISESRRLQGLGSNQRESLLRETAR